MTYLLFIKNNLTPINTNFYKIHDRTSCFRDNQINKIKKDAATKQRLWDNLMATVGTAVTTTAVVSAVMSLAVVMVVVVTLGFGVIV